MTNNNLLVCEIVEMCQAYCILLHLVHTHMCCGGCTYCYAMHNQIIYWTNFCIYMVLYCSHHVLEMELKSSFLFTVFFTTIPCVICLIYLPHTRPAWHNCMRRIIDNFGPSFKCDQTLRDNRRNEVHSNTIFSMFQNYSTNI